MLKEAKLHLFKFNLSKTFVAALHAKNIKNTGEGGGILES